ncbi:MAG TPA: DUF1016 domain-containing protein, partial [Nanoarchaeota archaeon]|nr:DUF1016 domain-containing protein [Nanoarchaeota archaeon]
MANIIPKGYGSLLGEIKERIRSAQYEALKAVNKEMILLYWDIGGMIVERQRGNTWGKSVVKILAKDLQSEFPGIKGFSAFNLWRMKKLYQNYYKNLKLARFVQEIGWGHNITIMEKCKDDLQREFYMRMAHKFGWTNEFLIIQIENQSYEKTLLNKTNFDKTLPAKITKQAKIAVKDEYTFDFLELGEEYSEKQLEQAALAKIRKFLHEMGGLFAFVDSQYGIEIDGEEFFIDILLYHRALKCLVALELKTGKFMPEYVGKMQFYLAVLDDKARMQGENPPIGIILCKSKNDTIVEYALKDSSKKLKSG